MEKIVQIKTPFFSAGKKFNWEGSSIGIGLAVSLLKGEGELRVQIMTSPNSIWLIDKKRARELVNKYKAFHMARGTRLGVVPWWAFYKYIEPEIAERQQNLF